MGKSKLPYVQQLASGKWRGFCTLRGRRVWSELCDSASEAHAHAMRMRAAATNPQIGETLSEACEALYEATNTNRTDGSLRWYRGHCDAVMRLIPGDTPLVAITREMIEEFVRDRLRDWARRPTAGDPGKRVKPATVNADLRALHRVFAVAIRRGVVKGNPVKQVDRPREDKAAMDWFRDDELREFLGRIEDQRTQDILALFALTGIRRSEAARLRRDDVRLRLRQIVVSGKTRTRIVPTAPDLDAVLTRLLADATDMLIGGGVREIDATFRNAKRLTGERRCHPHAMRHTFGTALIRGGARPDVVMRLMGHQSINTTLLYLHEVGEDAAEATASLRLLPSMRVSRPG